MASRHTVQQRIIGEQLRALGNHPTADDVYHAVSEQRPSISKATVYRALHKMADAGDALRVQVAGGAEHFDHRTDAHYHVVCSSCGRMDDVEADAVSAVGDSLAGIEGILPKGSSGYAITGYSLLFSGVCPACQQAEEKGVQ